jgi:hypothetical protein
VASFTNDEKLEITTTTEDEKVPPPPYIWTDRTEGKALEIGIKPILGS